MSNIRQIIPTSKNIGIIDYEAGRPASVDLPINQLYTGLSLCLEVVLAHGDADRDPSEENQGGLLNLMRDIHIEVNGNRKLFPTSGRSLYVKQIQDEFQAPLGLEPIDPSPASQTIIIQMPYNFKIPLVIDGERGKLNLYNSVGDEYRITSAKVAVNWGDLTDCFSRHEGLSVQSAKLHVRASLDDFSGMKSFTVPARNSIFQRVTREVNTAYRSSEEGIMQVEIPRVKGSILRSVAIMRTWYNRDVGGVMDFGDMEEIKVTHGVTETHSWTIAQLRDERYRVSQGANDPGNMAFIEFAERHKLDGINDLSLDDPLKLHVPIFGSPTDQNGNDNPNYSIDVICDYYQLFEI